MFKTGSFWLTPACCLSKRLKTVARAPINSAARLQQCLVTAGVCTSNPWHSCFPKKQRGVAVASLLCGLYTLLLPACALHVDMAGIMATAATTACACCVSVPRCGLGVTLLSVGPDTQVEAAVCTAVVEPAQQFGFETALHTRTAFHGVASPSAPMKRQTWLSVPDTLAAHVHEPHAHVRHPSTTVNWLHQCGLPACSNAAQCSLSGWCLILRCDHHLAAAVFEGCTCACTTAHAVSFYHTRV
ncbi:hypothetical protein COO60DRAFT_1490872 [Scenedesmus sp. NREL 46B-D3]|nr:hypothetical protein COO60DRAFT_1490872 [Scenedesmus sp. NREL 46B-D3]